MHYQIILKNVTAGIYLYALPSKILTRLFLFFTQGKLVYNKSQSKRIMTKKPTAFYGGSTYERPGRGSRF